MEEYTNYLIHHGVKGQKWGVRRYQNPDGSLTDKGKKKYIKEMYKDMRQHFRNNISEEARKVTALGNNGYANRGLAWSKAYRKGKVTSKDWDQTEKASKEARQYTINKYGQSAFKAMQRSGVLGRKIDDFQVKQSIDIGKKKIY